MWTDARGADLLFCFILDTEIRSIFFSLSWGPECIDLGPGSGLNWAAARSLKGQEDLRPERAVPLARKASYGSVAGKVEEFSRRGMDIHTLDAC